MLFYRVDIIRLSADVLALQTICCAVIIARVSVSGTLTSILPLRTVRSPFHVANLPFSFSLSLSYSLLLRSFGYRGRYRFCIRNVFVGLELIRKKALVWRSQDVIVTSISFIVFLTTCPVLFSSLELNLLSCCPLIDCSSLRSVNALPFNRRPYALWFWDHLVRQT